MKQENLSSKSQFLQERAINFIRSKSSGSRPHDYCEINVNFHPDRKTINGDPILVVLARDGLLKTQFETGTSNGGLAAFLGGDRWKWEHKAFNGIYDQSPPEERPKYGTLNFQNLAMGASPRFGSACFRLKPHVLERATFCYPDSYFNPKDFSTYECVSRLIKLSSSGSLDELV